MKEERQWLQGTPEGKGFKLKSLSWVLSLAEELWRSRLGLHRNDSGRWTVGTKGTEEASAPPPIPATTTTQSNLSTVFYIFILDVLTDRAPHSFCPRETHSHLNPLSHVIFSFAFLCLIIKICTALVLLDCSKESEAWNLTHTRWIEQELSGQGRE